MNNKELPPEVEFFLRNRCKPKEFTAVTIMVNNEVFEDFVKHFNDFYNHVCIVNNNNGEIVLLGQGKESKFEVIEGDKNE